MNLRTLCISGLLISLPSISLAQDGKTQSSGILLLAHGGNKSWDEQVNGLAAEVDKTVPVEVAFGMATKRNIQVAIDRLVKRGVREITAIPLFVSSHSSVITATQYLLGLRAEAPPELSLYAKMRHDHGGESADDGRAADFNPTTPVRSPVPIRMTAALDRHPLVAEMLLSRAQSMSKDPAGEVVIVVAHGPVSEENNRKWLADMRALVERMRSASAYHRIECLTLRDDAPEPIRAGATKELRAAVDRVAGEGNRALIVPLLISYGGIERGIRKRLEGLNYVIASQALLPDARLARWVLDMARHTVRSISLADPKLLSAPQPSEVAH